MGFVPDSGSQLSSPLTPRIIGTKYILSCCASFVAESVTYPLDVTKTRLQIVSRDIGSIKNMNTPRTMFGITWHIFKDEGMQSLFSGLSAAIYRHFIYSGFRMVIYEVMRAAIHDEEKKNVFPLWQSAICGLVSGAGAQFFASPADLVKVQMQTEGLRRLQNLPPRFRSSLHAFVTLYKKNGFVGLWTGWLPNTQRAALLNMADLATYDRTKHWLLAKGYVDDWYTHFIGSVVSGIASAAVSTPADVVKTRIMDQLRCNDEKSMHYHYKGSYDCLKRICREEGFFALYKGFVPSYIRSAPWSLVFWITYEEIRHLNNHCDVIRRTISDCWLMDREKRELVMISSSITENKFAVDLSR